MSELIRVSCHTNLDLSYEVWPKYLPSVPRVGDLIQSTVRHGMFQLELQVCEVIWKEIKNYNTGLSEWVPHIELHLSDFHKQLQSRREGAATGSITAFYEWYAPMVGRSVGSFI